MFENKDDTILARWLAGTLTPEERAEFEQSPEYKEYIQIAEGLEQFKKPNFNREALYGKIKIQIDEPKKGKVINFKPLLYISSVAASLLLIVSIFFNEVTYETNTGQQLSFTLPDGSEVQLNAASKLTRSRFFWKNNRKVNLEGEGFFKVESGNDFVVKTISGVVSVLGTEFNIRSRTDLFELTCYEGKVAFEAATSKEQVILTEGKTIQLIDDTLEEGTIEERTPSWADGRSSFNNVPLIEVLNELKIQYGIRIENNTVDISKRFTGSFFHNNLEIALKAVLVPMGIEYTLTDNKKTVELLPK